jgi:RHS repeat-associated protein
VKAAGGAVLASYTYDALGRRVQATIGSVTRRYYYSGAQMIEERDGSDARLRFHIPGCQYVDEQVATYDDATGRWEYYLLGAQFNVIGRGNSDGSAIEAVDYASSGDFAGRQAVSSPFDFDRDLDVDYGDFMEFQACFTGPLAGPPDLGCEDKDLDHDSDVDEDDFEIFEPCFSGTWMPIDPACLGSNLPASGSFTMHGLMVDVLPDGKALLYARARHYDMKHGRWLQRDPLGFIDGPNLYEAFGGNALSSMDPFGTQDLTSNFLFGPDEDAGIYRPACTTDLRPAALRLRLALIQTCNRLRALPQAITGAIGTVGGAITSVFSAPSIVATPAAVAGTAHSMDVTAAAVYMLVYGEDQSTLTYSIPHPHYLGLATEFVDCWSGSGPQVTPQAAAMALLTAGQADSEWRKNQSVELVWTGPEAESVPFRRTEQVILQVLDSARQRITLVSYAVYRIPHVCESLIKAAGRSVKINVIIETPDELEGRNEYSTLQALGDEVAACTTLYYWPEQNREVSHGDHPGILHVKCIVADSRWLFLSSANLTEYAFTVNMELGVLITGGGLPGKVESHFDRLISLGVLTRP